jgi:signal transduction histidine kinase/DNA-binding response OmpR family regulator
MDWTMGTEAPEEADILADLVRETLLSLLPVTLALSWLWLVSQIFGGTDHLAPAYLVLGLVTTATLIGYRLAGPHVRLATAVYLVALLATVTLVANASAADVGLNLYLLVVIVAGMLVGPRTLGLTATASVGLVLAVGLRTGLPAAALVSPIVAISLTALMAWLSSRRLFTALAWALTMTGESQKNLREARERRAEVLRILKSLDEAYVRLEWANEALMFAREAAQKAYRFKAEFVANVSHELRTPLNLIVGFSEMMATAPESYRGATLPSEYRGDIIAIFRSARHLADLIDDVLDLSKIDAGRLPLHREPTDLEAVIDEAVAMVRGLAEPKGLRLAVSAPPDLPVLYLDRTRIRQVLLNLLTNAVRFTDAGGIHVQVDVEGPWVTVAVEDSGLGIAPDRLAQAFESFSQLQDDQAREGNGLGLALSKRFVELHGGAMGIESQVNRGTIVRFTLPSDRIEVAWNRSEMTTSAAERGEKPHVVVVHDEPYAQAVLERYVEGYRFVRTSNLADALTMVRATAPVAVVLDAAGAAQPADRADLAGIRSLVPSLIGPLPSRRRLGLLLGGADYLVKPISRDDLLGALSRLGRTPQSVLLIDDDPGFVRLLARVLTAASPALRIREASSGPEGLEIARSQRPDLIILDLLMPGMSGYTVLAALRRDETFARTDVILMSARDLEEENPALDGEVHLSYPGGFSLTQLAQCIQGFLAAVTAPEAVMRDGARERRGDRSAAPAW